MGRFYKTAKPEFRKDNMYTPPWELMQNTILAKEQEVDKALAQAELLDGSLDTIQHLNFPAEQQRVEQLQEKYRSSVDSLTEQISANPLEYNKFMPQIRKLQRELSKDRSTGEWSDIEGRRNAYSNWIEENKELKNSNPSLYNKLNQHWYSDIVQRGTQDSSAQFQGTKGIDKPDLVEGYRLHFQNIKENATEFSDGKYKIGNKWITEEEVSNIAWNTLSSDKNYKGFVNQMGNVLGEEGYNEAPFKLVGKDGKDISFDDYQNLSDEDKAGVSKVLNSENPFYSDLSSVSQTYGFSQSSITEDKYGLQQNKGNIDSRIAQQKAANAAELEILKQQGKTDLLIKKYELMGERDKELHKDKLKEQAEKGDKKAEKVVNELEAKETIGVLGNPAANYDKDKALITTRTIPISDNPEDGTYIYAVPGTTEYIALQRNTNSIEYAKGKLASSDIELSSGDSFKASEYFEWLGPREHTEDTAKDFLESKQGIYQKNNFDMSAGEKVAEGARWMPSFLKSEQAQDWDKLYQIGNKYQDYKEEWYDNYSSSYQQVYLEPVSDAVGKKSMEIEIRNNSQNFYFTDENGDMIERDVSDLDFNSQMYVTPANSRGQMGIRIKNSDKEDVYIFPDSKDDATSNLMFNHSIQSVNPDSQYFKEMSNRVSTDLTHKLKQKGKNTKGTQSIITNLNGIELSLELIGNEVHLRQPDQSLSTEATKVYSNMGEFVKHFYSIKN